MRADVVVIGGGVMGCACAWELSRSGSRVLVLERSVPGAEASSAAAGILGAQVEVHEDGALARLARESRRLYPRFARDLTRATGIDVEYRECGVLRVAYRASELEKLARSARWQTPRPRLLDRRSLARREPHLAGRVAGGLAFDGDARVDPRLLLRALRIAAARAGATFRSGATVRGIVKRGNRAVGIRLDDGSVVGAADVIVAAGSWTTLVEGTGLAPGAVVPARGQIVELEAAEPLLSSVVFGPGAYLVPRDDGRVLVGSTVEFVGYQREVTAGAVRDLLDAALKVVPKLREASLRSSWSSFRPYTKNELPLIGKSGTERLWLATGHYRNGILLAPVTAVLVADLVRGKKPKLALAAFAPSPSPAML